ncbi:MAG: hypothetical protein GY838_15930 [bacterium]|nr:hypothetical protein [bacterium]
MVQTAHLSTPAMIDLMERMPVYCTYRGEDEAAAAEKDFRHALGGMLKDCGDRLLNVAERKGNLLGAEQNATIDELIDRIGAIFRRLDREGIVCLVGDCHATIAELEELDTRLILLVEEAAQLVRALEGGVPSSAWFKDEAGRLSRDLQSFSEMAEERNYLLGLGWESEFTWPGRTS